MLPMPLPAIDPSAKPSFVDANACEYWLSQLQLTDIRLAHQTLANELDQLNRFALAASERLRILELLRDTVAFAQAQYAKKTFGRPLPLSEAEISVLTGIVELWQRMVTGYLHCLQGCLAGEREMQQYKALICQRCLGYAGQQILEYVRARYEFAPELWLQLHGLYAFAEEQGIAEVPVEDSLNQGASTASCGATYAKTLLTCLANPYELSRPQLRLLDRWLDAWCSGLVITAAAPETGNGSPALEVDLQSANGLQCPEETTLSPAKRFLAMAPLIKALREKAMLLQEGETAARLDLGEDGAQPDCGALLDYLIRQWSDDWSRRFLERRSAAEKARICYGLPAIHYHVSGKPFKEPKQSRELTPQQRKEIEAFGHVLSEDGTPRVRQPEFPLETWEIEDESPLGLRLRLRERSAERFGINRIIGAFLPEGDSVALGVIRWITVGRNGDIAMGVRTLPGIPQAVAIRAAGVNPGVPAEHAPAFMLPLVAALQTPPSLIMPCGWFRQERAVEIYGEMPQKVKLQYLVEEGADFERASFIPT